MNNIVWQDGVPTSPEFEDLYFSKNDGLKESEYVFLSGNNLKNRFKEAINFTIIETGFGTGLNFLAAWDLWENSRKNPAKLHFISVEKFPLTKKDIQQAHLLWPELKKLSTCLLQKYPSTFSENITINLSSHCQLTLLFDDVNECLSEIKKPADAWFLDGFAPAKNPDMWTNQLYQNMKRLSKPGTTVATFTAAKHVREGLVNSGFQIERIKGYSYKKHMVIGQVVESDHP